MSEDVVIRATAQPTAAVRLVCFSHAGGGPMTYRRWAVPLAPAIELWSVTLPGRAGRRSETFAREWTPLTREIASAIAECVRPPVALFGHSLGALLAFETACELERLDRDASHLVVSGRDAPDSHREYLMPETDESLLDHIDAVFGGVPEAVRDVPELLAHFLPILRADLELVAAYRWSPRPPLACPITALRGVEDPTVTPDLFGSWSRRTSAAFEARTFPGGHFYLDRAEPDVLTAIRSCLLSD